MCASVVAVANEGNHLEGSPVAQRIWRQRQIRIARAVLAGITLARIAEQECVSDERIRQILHMACVNAIRLPKSAGPIPDRSLSISSIREHKNFWRARLAALERLWRLPKEKGNAGSARPSRPSARRTGAAPEHSASRPGSPGPRPTRHSRKTRHGQ